METPNLNAEYIYAVVNGAEIHGLPALSLSGREYIEKLKKKPGATVVETSNWNTALALVCSPSQS